jgi:hypothetical protein
VLYNYQRADLQEQHSKVKGQLGAEWAGSNSPCFRKGGEVDVMFKGRVGQGACCGCWRIRESAAYNVDRMLLLVSE